MFFMLQKYAFYVCHERLHHTFNILLTFVFPNDVNNHVNSVKITPKTCLHKHTGMGV